MIPLSYDRKDSEFLHWVHDELGDIECLFCSQKATDWCHVQHGSHRQSDYLGYPACNGCHIQLDHQARGHGPRTTLRRGYADEQKAVWFTFSLPLLLERYEAYLEALG